MFTGLPVLLCGTTDLHKHFHPFSLNICTNETETDFCFMIYSIKKACFSFYQYDYKPNTLIADAAPAITNGFMLAFGYSSISEFNRVMC